DKLRPWLCGIVRNLAANALRRERRRGGAAPSLNAGAEPPPPAADPAAPAGTPGEAGLPLRTPWGLSETYREPMVVFYRHGQSVAEVARSLDLAEDAVKQRLSRGRSLLREELMRVVETTLTRSRPTRVFTAAVLAVLPAVTPQSAEAAVVESVAAGTGAAVAKGALGGLGKAAILGAAIGLLLGLFSAKSAASTGPSPEGRG